LIGWLLSLGRYAAHRFNYLPLAFAHLVQGNRATFKVTLFIKGNFSGNAFMHHLSQLRQAS